MYNKEFDKAWEDDRLHKVASEREVDTELWKLLELSYDEIKEAYMSHDWSKILDVQVLLQKITSDIMFIEELILKRTEFGHPLGCAQMTLDVHSFIRELRSGFLSYEGFDIPDDNNTEFTMTDDDIMKKQEVEMKEWYNK